MKKIVLFKGGVETQAFFSLQLEKAFKRFGHETFVYDFENEAASAYQLLMFIEKGNTIMITFNFHGICNEEILRDDNGIYIWEGMNIPCYNIVVDHPFYYDRFMPQLPPDYKQISIDKNHQDYLKRFYPHIDCSLFLPLAGTCFDWEEPVMKRIKDRDIEVVFTGSWADPEFWGSYMSSEGPEYEKFYRQVLKQQIDNPSKTFEEIFEPAIRLEAEDTEEITDDLLRETYAHLIHFDMYVRYYYRGRVIRELVDNGIKVVCVGGGWDKLDCMHPENITHIPYVDSAECLRLIRNSKISINVMPWFKRGTHDRIYNSMLNGAVCVTDSSEFLDNQLTDGTNCRVFSLEAIDKVPEIVKELLADETKMQSIADAGYEFASNGQTWEDRALSLKNLIGF